MAAVTDMLALDVFMRAVLTERGLEEGTEAAGIATWRLVDIRTAYPWVHIDAAAVIRVWIGMTRERPELVGAVQNGIADVAVLASVLGDDDLARTMETIVP